MVRAVASKPFHFDGPGFNPTLDTFRFSLFAFPFLLLTFRKTLDYFLMIRVRAKAQKAQSNRTRKK